MAKPKGKTIFMPAKMLKKWLQALLHGDYKQANHTLYDPESGGFCCLGVMQHANCDGQVEVRESNPYGFGERDGEFLNMPSMEWLRDNGVVFINSDGKPDEDPWLPKLKKSAAEANDDNVSFRRIAQAIEAAAIGY